jgi:hypothetical protein
VIIRHILILYSLINFYCFFIQVTVKGPILSVFILVFLKIYSAFCDTTLLIYFIFFDKFLLFFILVTVKNPILSVFILVFLKIYSAVCDTTLHIYFIFLDKFLLFFIQVTVKIRFSTI